MSIAKNLSFSREKHDLRRKLHWNQPRTPGLIPFLIETIVQIRDNQPRTQVKRMKKKFAFCLKNSRKHLIRGNNDCFANQTNKKLQI